MSFQMKIGYLDSEFGDFPQSECCLIYCYGLTTPPHINYGLHCFIHYWDSEKENNRENWDPIIPSQGIHYQYLKPTKYTTYRQH